MHLFMSKSWLTTSAFIILPIHQSEFSMENQMEMPFYAPILDLPENKTMMYGGIAAIIILGVGFWFFVGRKKGKFHAQGKEMMNKAKVKVQNAPTANNVDDKSRCFRHQNVADFCHQTPSPTNLNRIKIK